MRARGLVRVLAGLAPRPNAAAARADRGGLRCYGKGPSPLCASAPPRADMSPPLLKVAPPLSNRQNTAAPGAPEVVSGPSSAVEGLYEVRVAVQNGTAADYAILLHPDLELPLSLIHI